jgi:4-hydroxy-tetrahydrodipicolinate synthase
MHTFSGIWIPLVTPFRDGGIDFAALRAMARDFIGAGISGLVACGTTGEAAALDETEQLAVLDAIIDAAPGTPVVMGLCDNNIASLLSRLEHIQQRSIAGILVPPPYYIRPSQQGLIRFFGAVADAATVPIIVYNIPARTGVSMELETLRAIARHERVQAIKDCGCNLALTMQLIADGELAVLAGEDQQILSTLCLGGSGAIAASAHLRPDLFSRLPQLVKEGSLDQAREIFYRLLPAIHLAFGEANPGPVKAALSMMGQLRDELRFPMQSASAELREALRTQLKHLECL